MDEKEIYFSLRDEVTYNQKQENEMTKFAYTVIVAILGTALTVDSKWITMLSLMIVIPISFRVARYRDSIAYLSTYMSVFLEPKLKINWEHDHSIYSNRYKRNYFSDFLYFVSRADFLFLSAISIVIFWLQNGGFILVNNSWIWTISLISFQFFVVSLEVVQFSKFSSIPKLKRTKLKNWKIIYCERNDEKSR